MGGLLYLVQRGGNWVEPQHIAAHSLPINGQCTNFVLFDVTLHALPLESKAPFITTQLNSTRRRVELSCIVEVSIATPTQLNSTQLDIELSTRSQRELSPISSERRDPVDSVCRRQWSCVGEGVYSDATQLNSTSS